MKLWLAEKTLYRKYNQVGIFQTITKYLNQLTNLINMKQLFRLVMITFILILSVAQVVADEIRVAVASNFTATMKSIGKHFEVSTGHKVTLIFGATGKHYAQIKNGAPFDAFFAADTKRPKLLEKEGLIQPDSRFTYVIGKLVLWSPWANYVNVEDNVLATQKFKYLAIANPRLAPYGKAAQEFLQKRGLWTALQTRMVRGENIGQTLQFVKSGNAELGFVALSQVRHLSGSVWIVPASLYTPIEQQAVLLKDNPVAQDFLDFVQNNNKSQTIIRRFGYDIP